MRLWSVPCCSVKNSVKNSVKSSVLWLSFLGLGYSSIALSAESLFERQIPNDFQLLTDSQQHANVWATCAAAYAVLSNERAEQQPYYAQQSFEATMAIFYSQAVLQWQQAGDDPVEVKRKLEQLKEHSIALKFETQDRVDQNFRAIETETGKQAYLQKIENTVDICQDNAAQQQRYMAIHHNRKQPMVAIRE